MCVIDKCVHVGAQLRSQPILRWTIAQLRILSWVAYLKMGLNILAQLRISKLKNDFEGKI